MALEDHHCHPQATTHVAGQHVAHADRIAALAMRLCHVAVALVVERDTDGMHICGSAVHTSAAGVSAPAAIVGALTPAALSAWDAIFGSDEHALIADTMAVPALAARAQALAIPAVRFVARRTLAFVAGAPPTALWLWDSAPRSLSTEEHAALADLLALAAAPQAAHATPDDRATRDMLPSSASAALAHEATMPPVTCSMLNRFHALLRNATDLVAINDSQGIVQYVSPSVTRILGYQPDEIIGRSSFDFLHPDDLAQIIQSFHVGTQTAGPAATVQMRFRHKDGEWRTLEATSNNLLDDPHVRGVLVNAHDITERQQAEAAHHASEARFQAIFSSAPVGIIATDHSGQIMLVNPPIAALFGYTSDALIGQPITWVLPDELPNGNNLALIGRHRTGTPLPVEISMTTITHADAVLRIAFVTDLRERQRMERALRESEDRYRSLVELAPDTVLVLRNGLIQFINRAGYTTLAATKDSDVLGHPITDFLVHSEVPIATTRLEARMRGQELGPTCYQVLARDGRVQQMEVASTLITYAGEPALLLVARDVTERSMHDQLMRFQASVLDQLSEAVVAIDVAGRITYINAAAVQSYGQNLHEVHGQPITALYTVEYFDQNEEVAAQQAMQAHDHWRGENRHVTNDGRVLIVDTAVVMLRADDGAPIGMFGVSRDITARKQIEERLRLLESVVIYANDAVMITSSLPIHQPGPQIVYVNAAFTRATGYTADEVVGQTPRMLQGPKTNLATLAQIRAALEQQMPIRVEVINYTKSGKEIWIDLSIAPVRNSAGMTTHYIAIQRDITERRQLEAQLLQSQKLESIGRLTGGIAHDFNNLLTGISGYADLALAEAEPASALYDDLLELRHGINRATELTRQLLLFARRQPVQQQQLHLNIVIRTLEKLLRRLIGADSMLQIDLDPQVPLVLLDRSQLEQVLVNLVINAHDAMPTGGTITISTRLIAAHAPEAATPVPAMVRLVVSDTGSGMTPEIQAHAFEPFFTTKAIGHGTGLGLSTVYGIIHQHGGSIQIASQHNQGTSIIIELPALTDDGEKPTSMLPAPAPLLGTETVLVVDDEATIRDLVARMLRNAGYSVYTAEHGKAAIALVQAPDTAPVALVVTDVMMPEMDGRRLGTFLAAEYPSIGVLYLSGNPGLNQAQSDAVPLAPLLPKPFTAHELLMAVRDEIQRKRHA